METQVATGIDRPTSMAFAADGRIFVCQQSGDLRVIKNGALLATPFATVTTGTTGERGLLGVAIDPNFVTNQYVYVYYTVTTGPIRHRLSRFTANGDVAAGGETILMEFSETTTTTHNGGAIHFGPDGKLYVATGDAGTGTNSQSMTTLHGKILRINSDGSIPTDNPFYATATGVFRAIWAIGLRNPFTFAFQPASGRMYINDVGEKAWEEINEGTAGGNYGWPATEGVTTDPQYRSPIHAYTHDQNPISTGCSIIGGAFYNPSLNQYPPEYFGRYFFADLCSGWVRSLNPATNATEIFATGFGQPVQVELGPDGFLYILTRRTGTLYRISYTPGYRTPTAVYRSMNNRLLLVASNSYYAADGLGLIAGEPAGAQDALGNTFAAALDSAGGLWLNRFDAYLQTWAGWVAGGGVLTGNPSITVMRDGTAYVAARDAGGASWLVSYRHGVGLGPWVYLGGVLGSDPSIAAAPDDSIYLVGRDSWGGIWSNRYVPGSGSQGWRAGGGITQGRPSVTVGIDGVAYVAARDTSGGLWLNRVSGNNWMGWTPGGGVLSRDPVIVANGEGIIYVAGVVPGGAVWYRPYTESTSNGWQSWVGLGGQFQSVTGSATKGELYLAGRDLTNGIWWYRVQLGQWRYVFQNSTVGSDLVGAPR